MSIVRDQLPARPKSGICMEKWVSTPARKLGWAAIAFGISVFVAIYWMRLSVQAGAPLPSDGQLLIRLLLIPALLACAVLALLTAGLQRPGVIKAAASSSSSAEKAPPRPFTAQVIGLQWLSPLHRRIYPVEWQLLWTLGLIDADSPGSDIEHNAVGRVRLQPFAPIVDANARMPEIAFHQAYIAELVSTVQSRFLSDHPAYYSGRIDPVNGNASASLHVYYALPSNRLDSAEAARQLADELSKNIGHRGIRSEVHVVLGHQNAGFSALAAALGHLRSNPADTTWVMSWDAPDFPSSIAQPNESMLLLILAGSEVNAGREPLARLGYPATASIAEFTTSPGQPSRLAQAWQATLRLAAHNANTAESDIAYAIHDAGATNAASARIGGVAQALTGALPEFDFVQQSFNAPAAFGDTGASSALTNLALAVAQANHVGHSALVAGTTDAERPIAVLAVPPSRIDVAGTERWVAASGEHEAFVPWRGRRREAAPQTVAPAESA